MGLLTVGRPLTWKETKEYIPFVREHGVEQFIQIYNRLKDRRNDCLKWGDEVRKSVLSDDDNCEDCNTCVL